MAVTSGADSISVVLRPIVSVIPKSSHTAYDDESREASALEIRIEDYKYCIRPGYTDMRRSTGLAYLVQYEIGLEPFSKPVFLFCGRRGKTIKAIVWDRNGWLCLTKRLDCGMPFIWPRTSEDARQVHPGTL